jgi:nitroimidazol reductase NimA-like FMN-containing flavoprotein (pyridoxamine 5'-phosphate oxidase superfamily)
MDTTIGPPRRTLEVLARDECLSLLAGRRHGRLAYCYLGRPHIEVLNFVVDGGDVVIRMGVGAKSAAIGGGGFLALEVDSLDDAGGTGWDVTVSGPVAWVTEPAELDRLGELLHCSAPGDRPHIARIVCTQVFGRRIEVEKGGSS